MHVGTELEPSEDGSFDRLTFEAEEVGWMEIHHTALLGESEFAEFEQFDFHRVSNQIFCAYQVHDGMATSHVQ
jgi:hypothetical protein